MCELTDYQKACLKEVEQMLASGQVALLSDKWSGGQLRFMAPRYARLYKHAIKKRHRVPKAA